MQNNNNNNLELENLVDNYGRMVAALCRRMIRESDQARDAAQEVWLEVCKSLPDFRGEAKVSTWLYTIASRVILRYSRDERQYSTRFLRGFFHGPERKMIPVEYDYDKKLWIREMCDKCLTGILHCLDNESRILYLLRDVAELSYEECSKVMEWEESAIRQRVSRARRKLKSFLTDECMLFNPQGQCKCRMNKLVKDIDLPGEYRKLHQITKAAHFLRVSEQILPEQNFWKNYL